MSERLERHQRVRALFEHVRSLPAETQATALAAACGDDAALQQDVTRLLDAAVQAGSFLERGAGSALTDPADLIGRRLGPYEILDVIGAGGMGQVYRAHDTTLGRDVALKVLPELLAADPDRLTRFQREAEVLASLNHPHIGAIYGVEQSDLSAGSGRAAVRALVLELVDGPTLAERIAQGALPLDEVLSVTRQIIAALEAAHERGIIHRDLKPANIKLREDGTVKVLDFGLAKALDPRSAQSDVAQSPAMAAPGVTQAGALLGTASYMSPEQAKGRAVDTRSDVWALGCVLFEMLSGTPAFGGEDVADTLASILTKEPDWTALPSSTPVSIRRVLRRCLAKDRRQRIAHVADVRLELDAADESTVDAASAPQAHAHRRLRGWWPWSLAAASLLLALGLGAIAIFNRQPGAAGVHRSSILLPGRLGAPADQRGATVALSPDGRRLAFVGTDANGRTQLWLRALDSLTARPIDDTERARTPFWSPDSRWIAFVADGALKKVDASGGPVVTLCDSAWAGGAWSRDEVIVFTNTSWGLARVDAAGGTPKAVTTQDFAANEWGHVSPSFLPDGRHVIYAAVLGSGDALAVYVASIDDGERTRLPVDAALVQFAHGVLWFQRGSTLMAQPFDANQLRTVGNAVPVAEQLRAYRNAGFFSVSEAGALVYQSDASPGHDLTWFDRTGRRTGTLGTRDDYADVALSPDGRRALVSVRGQGVGDRDLWIFDIARGVRTRLTSDPTAETHSAWSPDGTRIVFDTRNPGHLGLFQKRSDGTGGVEVLLADGYDNNPTAWSPDGRFILYVKRDGGTVNLWALPLEGDRKPFALTRSAFNVPAQFSPDGRWVVYGSNDSGQMEIYVAPFPGPGASSLVSTGGGWDPRWRRDGKEIVYLDVSRTRLMSAMVTMDHERVDVTDVKPLFELAKVGPRSTYDMSADGQRILAVTQSDEAAAAPLTLVLNWPGLLQQ